MSAETQRRERKKDPTGLIVVGMEKQGALCEASRTQWPVAYLTEEILVGNQEETSGTRKLGMGRTLPGQNLTPGSSHNSRETSSGLGAGGRKQFCPALHLSAPHHLGLESFHFSQDVCFISYGSDSSLGGMHRAEGLPAPLPGLPGWGGERCSPDPDTRLGEVS